jgi:hypothetical protein
MASELTPEAEAILGTFGSRGLREGSFIGFEDFGGAIVWEAGFIRDEAVRSAFAFLVEGGYVFEMSAGLMLGPKGVEHLYGPASPSGIDPA